MTGLFYIVFFLGSGRPLAILKVFGCHWKTNFENSFTFLTKARMERQLASIVQGFQSNFPLTRSSCSIFCNIDRVFLMFGNPVRIILPINRSLTLGRALLDILKLGWKLRQISRKGNCRWKFRNTNQLSSLFIISYLKLSIKLLQYVFCLLILHDCGWLFFVSRNGEIILKWNFLIDQ